MQSILIIGCGYVGLVSAACLSEFGHSVICMDVDKDKIKNLKKGIIPIYEPGLQELVEKNLKVGRLTFTTDIKKSIEVSKIIFIAVGTPTINDGSADLTFVFDVASSIGDNINEYKVVVNKSTVPVGTGKKVKDIIDEKIKKRNVNYDFNIVSNPEFLREGSAVSDFMHPDRIVIGTDSEQALSVMKQVYSVLFLNNHPFVFTKLESAEVIKYASNAFLSVKISFINEIANICENVGADIHEVAKAIGLDKRIGKYFLHSGPGYGGSCFPKDNDALVKTADQFDCELNVVKAAQKTNKEQKLRMVKKITNEFKNNIENKTIAVLGLSFKPRTDDMREASSLTIINELLSKGAKIKVFDPVSMSNAKNYYLKSMDVYYATDEYDAVSNADALVIITEWNEFRSLNLEKIKNLMNGKLFFDLRNIYSRDLVESTGFKYIAVGR